MFDPIFIIVALIIISLLAIGLVIYFYSSSEDVEDKSRLQEIMSAQQEDSDFRHTKSISNEEILEKIAQEQLALRESGGGVTGKLTLERKLEYAKLLFIPASTYRLIQAAIILICIVFVILFLPNEMLVPLALLAIIVPLYLTESFIHMMMMRRTNDFDADYPVMLLSYVSLLRTGMTPLYGLESAGKSLAEGGILRDEIEILIERLKLGMSEEHAIGSFGEDIYHPEIELFVQSLILSMSVGGKLSTTLERLSKQVRMRQVFRKKALSAVALERSSLMMVFFIMIALLVFIRVKAPVLMKDVFVDPVGLLVVGWSIFLVVLGLILSRLVVKVKV